MSKSTNSPFRLPDFIRPKKYFLSITPDLIAQTYSGNVTIDIDIYKKTDTIYLHAKDLNILGAFVRQGKIGYSPKLKFLNKDNAIEFKLGKKISGKTEISISFTGIIHNDLRGFYISKHDGNGEEMRIGATQFEAIDARRAFPCFDEPDFKAVFQLEIVTEKDLTVLSNTEEISFKETAENKIEHTFAETPVMSTYLLAWCIGKFEYVTSAANSGTVVRAYTVPGKKETAKFALSTATKVLDFFEDYFGIDYPLNKLDLIALPDFASGAMENWGLITFRETCLLVDKNDTALTNKEFVALVTAHEIAHQWFGNLVTMKWWDDLWLNEGFANYIEYVAIDAIYPSWKIWEEFTQGDMGSALSLDALHSSHPIEVPIRDAHDIDEVFDDITYRKGASVIRMLAEYTGPKNFQKGIRSYMKANMYKNATTKNLWAHLEKASRKPVSRVMGAWTRQAGFPIVSIEEKNGFLVCSQCRYYRNRNLTKNPPTGESKTVWPIPIDDGKKIDLLPAKKINKIKAKDIYTLNQKESNLVHFDYPESFIKKQKENLGKISAIERMGLIRNMRALCENGSANTAEALEYLKLFKNEKNHIVISEMWHMMLRISHVFGMDETVEEKLHSYYKTIFENIWAEFSWDKDKKADIMRSSIILAAAYKLKNEKLIEESLNKFRNPGQIHPQLRSSVYRIVVRYGEEKDKAKLWKILNETKLHEEKMRILASFAAVVKARDLIDVLDYYMSDSVKTQDRPLLIVRLLNETNKPEMVWNFVEHHWGEFVEVYGKGGHLLPRLISGFAAIRDEGTLKHIKGFFKKYPLPAAKMTISQVYEKIEGALAYKKSDIKKLEEFLKEYV